MVDDVMKAAKVTNKVLADVLQVDPHELIKRSDSDDEQIPLF